MNYLLETNPAFIIIPVENDNYVFYNSLQHTGTRLTHLEMLILDMYYRYQDKSFILQKFDNKKRNLIETALDLIDTNKLLLCEDIEEPEDSVLPKYPSVYYLHLTYLCNLNCSYCYNRDIRIKNKSELQLSEWKRIIDKIAPFAKEIILTGGEFFLFEDLLPLLIYINKKCPNAKISGISNGMHDFENAKFSEAFNYISDITFSCDSISREGERKGFNPSLYKRNLKWIKTRYPNIKISVSSTFTCSNSEDLKETECFCNKLNLNFAKIILIPQNSSEINMMPDLQNMDFLTDKIQNSEIKSLKKATFRCGAGKSVSSIDPAGNLYPCQSLHFPEFKMGNILNDNFQDLKYFAKRGHVLKSVNEFSVCSKCNVKYICGGGCPATAYSLYGGKIEHNHLLCGINHYSSIQKLKALNNRK